LVVVVLALLAVAVIYRLQSRASPGKGRSSELAVSLVPVQVQDVPVLVDVNGAVVAQKTVDVRAQVANLVRQVHVAEGQSVRRGQLLFSLEDGVDRANVDKARAQLERDRALLADLERQVRRAEELKAQGFVAQSAVDASRAQHAAQSALVKSDEAALAASRVVLDYDQIRAPIDGRLGAIGVYPGSLVQPASGALVTVTQLDPVAVQFNLPESHLQGLQAVMRRRHDAANVTASIPGATQALRGQLYFVDNAVDAASGTIKAKAQFANAKHLLWPGQFVQVRIELDSLPGAMTIPAAALITSVTGTIVYVANDDHTVQAKPVKVRFSFGEAIAVDGLQPTDQVVTDGKQNLRAGSRIRTLAKASAEPDARPGKRAKAREQGADQAGKP
jgi:RND family efflux transporter MFP subunit